MHALHAVPLLARASALWQRGRTSIYHVQNYTPRAIEQVLTAAGFGAIRIEVRNELSWPLPMYVRLLLLAPLKLPGWLAPVIAPVFAPVLSTNLCNANKGIAWARKVA